MNIVDRLEDMKVAQVEFFDGWGDEDDPKSDWSLIQKHCCFSHTEACEFIVFVGSDAHLDNYKEAGFSEEYLTECKKHSDAGFKYVCFYS